MGAAFWHVVQTFMVYFLATYACLYVFLLCFTELLKLAGEAKHRGMKRSAEAKQKMRERKLGILDGTIWISNELLRQEKQVFKDSELFKELWDDGWKMGRLYGTSSWLRKKCFTTS